MKNVFLALFFLGLLNACDDENDTVNSQAYLVFGHFYGMCVGEGCVQTYKLTEKQLFKDTEQDYSGENVKFVVLEDEKFELVKDLMNHFPRQLLAEKEIFLGCPDCADGGGLFIQYSDNGNIRTWRIDQVKSNVPDYLHSFMDRVNAKITLLG
tara:strand:- start:203363 stop:203821 length:459 start_codon:yes stop_codon:yes gene_type:complete